MAISANYGDPPANAHDALLIKGIYGTSTPPKKVILSEPIQVSHAKGLVIGLCFAITFIILITGARLFTRAFRKGQVWGADDWVIIPAAIICLAYLSGILARVSYACAGKHINYCTYAELGLFLSIGAIGQILFFAGVTLVKISMVLFNKRLTGLSSRRWIIFHNVFLSLLICWWFISFFINLFQCRPVTGFFNFATHAVNPDYKCLDRPKISQRFSVINAVTDFMLLCVPIIVLFKVQMPLGRKIRLCALFLVGAICCVASVVRWNLATKNTHDLTWVFVPQVSWTIVDVFFSCIVASLPALNAIAEIGLVRFGAITSLTSGSKSRTRSDAEFASRPHISHSETFSKGLPLQSISSPRSTNLEHPYDIMNDSVSELPSTSGDDAPNVGWQSEDNRLTHGVHAV